MISWPLRDGGVTGVAGAGKAGSGRQVRKPQGVREERISERGGESDSDVTSRVH